MPTRRRAPARLPDCLVPTEDEEQIMVFTWAELQSGAHPELDLLYHIPNEGKRSKAQGELLKKKGLKKGVPDICLPVARGPYHALYIELKRQRYGATSQDQKDWVEALTAEGNRAVVCKGGLEAIETISRYLSLK